MWVWERFGACGGEDGMCVRRPVVVMGEVSRGEVCVKESERHGPKAMTKISGTGVGTRTR